MELWLEKDSKGIFSNYTILEFDTQATSSIH